MKIQWFFAVIFWSQHVAGGEYVVINETSSSGKVYYVELFFDGGTPGFLKDDKSLGKTIIRLSVDGVEEFQVSRIIDIDGVLLFVIGPASYSQDNFYSWVTSADVELNHKVLAHTGHIPSEPPEVKVAKKESQNKIVAHILRDWRFWKGNYVDHSHKTPPLFYLRRGDAVAVYAIARDWHPGKEFTVYKWKLSEVFFYGEAFIDLTTLPSGEYNLMIATSNGDIIGGGYNNIR